MNKTILITGSAGFIGMHAVLAFSKLGYRVVGIDNLNTYYDVRLKLTRLEKQGIDSSNIEYNKVVKGMRGIEFIQLDISDKGSLDTLFSKYSFDTVLNLAAQAGVRYSLENPDAYLESNVTGFLNILECSKNANVKHLVFASSSSVYGSNTKVPFEESDQTDNQESLYAATKKANESMAHSYASVYGMKISGLRFFTVYGPYGRPDMALFKFTKHILNGEPIDVYNNGNLSRDFTYVDDIIDGIIRLVEKASPTLDDYQMYNIGRGEPVQLMAFVNVLENTLKIKAKIHFMPMQKGDVFITYASTKKLNEVVGYKSQTSLKEGVTKFVDWYTDFYDKNIR